MNGRNAMVAGVVLAALAMQGGAAAGATAAAVVKQRFDAVRRHDIEAIVALYAPGAVETSPGFCHERIGPAGARQTYTELFQAYPDISDDVVATVSEGTHVAVQFFARSRKPDGSLLFEVPLANFLTVEHGRITRDDTYFDAKGRPCG